MVRRNKPSSGEFARLWDQMTPWQQRQIITQVRAALRPLADDPAPLHVGGEGDGETGSQDTEGHPPHFGQHSHLHNAHGHHTADKDGKHSHVHQHGRNDETGTHWDNDHNHPHNESDFSPAAPSENPWERAPERNQGQYRRHVRFERGRAEVLNRAGRGRPVSPRQQIQINAAWSALSQTARQIERGGYR